VEIVMLGARASTEWDDAQAMLRHLIPPAFWRALREQGLLPDAAPTPGDLS
jgi:D-threo-aldose 1-dehydrogenase